jgi:hypothetical protein
LITPQSIAWIESYVVMKILGGVADSSTPARDVDAFLVLEDLIAKERSQLAADLRQPETAVRRER